MRRMSKSARDFEDARARASGERPRVLNRFSPTPAPASTSRTKDSAPPSTATANAVGAGARAAKIGGGAEN